VLPFAGVGTPGECACFMTKVSPDAIIGDRQPGRDRRHERRLLVELEHASARLSAYTHDISLSGLFIETEAVLPCDTEVLLRFSVPTQREAIEVRGQVRWREKKCGEVEGMGIRFEGLRPRDVWALNRFFELSADKPRDADEHRGAAVSGTPA
jgi:uncharacterized protein (TIGR02266 family)